MRSGGKFPARFSGAFPALICCDEAFIEYIAGFIWRVEAFIEYNADFIWRKAVFKGKIYTK